MELTRLDKPIMDFRISGLPISQFAQVLRADPRAPEDAAPGEEVLLLTHAHQPGPSAYAASGPIFIRRHATATAVLINQVPGQQRRRLLSIRAYDHRNWIIDAEVTPGSGLESLIERLFSNREVAYLHVHNARHGCYACRVDRA